MLERSPPRLSARLATPTDLQNFRRFDCGAEDYQQDLVRFLHEDAVTQAARRYSTTYVFYDDQERPLAFVTLSCASIEPWDAFDDRDEIPMLLVEMLAVDRTNQQQGIGSEVMRWIREKADSLGVGCRFIALYCNRRNTSAQAFYRRQGFFEAPSCYAYGDEALWLFDLAAY
jgi:GNAT superfamily N-acetyltransferase